MKQLSDLAWNVSEEEYRESPAFNYSLISKFDRGGFDVLSTLKEKEISPNLTFGSVVDCLLTVPQEFDKKYAVCDFPDITEKIESTVKVLFTMYGTTYKSLNDIPLHNLLDVLDAEAFQKTYKNETRTNNILTKGDKYYQTLCNTVGKEVIPSETYIKAISCVEAVKNHEIAKKYFTNNPFDETKNYYQLKFKTELDGIEYKGMLDVIHVDYKNKTIDLIDLKTSGKPEWHFPESFIKWNYSMQSRLYFRIVYKILKEDDFFSDFTINPYKFVVVCAETLCPLVWEFEATQRYGDLQCGSVVMKDPENVAMLLKQYFEDEGRKTPYRVEVNEINSLMEKLEEYEIENKSKM